MAHPQYYYVDFVYSLAGLNEEDVGPLDAVTVKSLILSNLKVFFGDTAVGVGFDLLGFRPTERRGVIRCPTSNVVKVRAALTLPSHYDGEVVSFHVIKASPFLAALLADSRSHEHKNYSTAKWKLHTDGYSV